MAQRKRGDRRVIDGDEWISEGSAEELEKLHGPEWRELPPAKYMIPPFSKPGAPMEFWRRPRKEPEERPMMASGGPVTGGKNYLKR